MPRPLSVLVVDDEEDIRDLVCEILETAGHRVVAAANGARALELLDAGTFDLMLCDVGMYPMSGWDVVSAARTRDPHLGIALLTGWDATLPQERIAAAGVDVVLGKPFQVDRILGVVDDLGGRRGGTKR